ncbi:MAG: carboxymuconolactone decarboxylase [Rhodospirillaceae bacterium]|nr:carboxymuconolactone decarboxylase [Rhodospirillaceae bacterium]
MNSNSNIRMQIPTQEELTDNQLKIYNSIKSGKRGEVPDLFMVLMHSPEVANHTQALGEKLRYNTSLPKYMSEMVILMVASFWRCPYEWHYHEPEAKKSGLTIKIINSIRNFKKPIFDDNQMDAVYNFTNELLFNRTIDDNTYNKALGLLGQKGIIELTSLIGYYCMIAMTLNEHQVPLPKDSPPKIP